MNAWIAVIAASPIFSTTICSTTRAVLTETTVSDLRLVDASLSDRAGSARRLSHAWYALNDTWLTESNHIKLKLIAELLSIKHHYFSLDLFNAEKVDVIIEFLCST